MSLSHWSRELSHELGIELEVDIVAVLDLARDAAHRVERPAAPLTTFLVGYAAALRGGSSLDVAECTRIATELTDTYTGE